MVDRDSGIENAGPLTRKVLDYDRTIKGLVSAPGDPIDWAPLAEFVAVDDFERVGTFLEVQSSTSTCSSRADD
jgi:hypothetical protein